MSCGGGRRFADHDVVRQDEDEGLVADEVAGGKDGVADALHLALPHVGDVGHLGDARALLAAGAASPFASSKRLDVARAVEVVLDGALVDRGDDDDLVDAGSDRLFDRVVNDRPVDERQHFFGLRLGERAASRVPYPAARITALRTWVRIRTSALG